MSFAALCLAHALGQGASPQPDTSIDLARIPDILKAVTDPFSLLALIVLILGLVTLRLFAGMPGRVRLIAFAICAVALVALGLNVVRFKNLRTENEPSALDQYLLAVTFRMATEVTEPARLSFETGSGQINVGCGDTASTTVSFALPVGAREVNARAEWERTDKLRVQTQQTAVAGTTVTAVGSIAGLERNFLGDCPGGGHGELVLRGTYVVDQPKNAPLEQESSKTIAAGDEASFELPKVSLKSGTIAVVATPLSHSGAGVSPYRAEWTLALTPDGRVTGLQATSAHPRLAVRIRDGQLVASVL